jgi:hypothetical protein
MTFVEDVEICRNSADGLKSIDTNASSDFVGLLAMLKEAESAAANIEREFHRPYPLQHLPAEIREVVSAAVSIVNCPEELAVQSVLNTLSVCIGAFHDATVFRRGGTQPVTLAQAGSAISGDRKSSVDNTVLKGIRQAAAQMNDAAKKDNNDPKLIGWSTGDATVEGAAGAFATSPVLTINSTDGASFLYSHSMKEDQKAQTLATLTQWWDGIGGTVIRARGNKDVNDPRLDISLMFQPEFFNRFVADDLFSKQGFAARFLYHPSKSKQGTRFISPEDDVTSAQEVMKVFHEKTGLFFKDGINGFEAGDDRILISRTPQAESLLVDYYNDIESLMAPDQPLHGDPYAQRIIEHAVRLASLFVSFDKRSSVTPEDIQPAIQLSKHYLAIWHGIRCRAVTDVLEAEARELLTKIVHKYSHDDYIEVRQLMQDFKMKRKHLDPLLRELADSGAIEFGEDNTRGKPKYIRVGMLDLVT